MDPSMREMPAGTRPHNIQSGDVTHQPKTAPKKKKGFEAAKQIFRNLTGSSSSQSKRLENRNVKELGKLQEDILTIKDQMRKDNISDPERRKIQTAVSKMKGICNILREGGADAESVEQIEIQLRSIHSINKGTLKQHAATARVAKRRTHLDRARQQQIQSAKEDIAAAHTQATAPAATVDKIKPGSKEAPELSSSPKTHRPKRSKEDADQPEKQGLKDLRGVFPQGRPLTTFVNDPYADE